MKALNARNIQNLAALIRTSNRITILTHSHPDGDAIGSCMALANFIGKNLKIIIPNEYPQNLAFIVNDDLIIDANKDFVGAVSWIEESDLIFALDFNSFSRIDQLETTLQSSNAEKVLIDHHLNPNLKEFFLVFSETEISSTCELLYYILSQLLEVFPLNIATPLFVGMTTDSNNFANSTYPSTLQMASNLLSIGVDRDNILMRLYNSFRENRLRAMGEFLSKKLVITPNGVAYAIFTKETLKEFDLQEGETESFVNLPLALSSVNYSIFLKEDQSGEYFRVSLRSKKAYSVARLASQYFNGGGHENAAGGRLYFPKDIETPDMAAQYIEEKTARFVQKEDNKNENEN